MIIYVQHLQICFKSAGTVEKRQPYKVYGAESAFLILVSDLFDPVGPPLTLHESYVVRREGTPICLAGVHVMELNRTP